MRLPVLSALTGSGRRAAALVGAVVVAVAFVVAAARSGSTHDVVDRRNPRLPAGTRPPVAPPPASGAAHSTAGSAPAWLSYVLWGLLAVIVLAALGYVASLIAAWRQGRGDSSDEDSGEELVDDARPGAPRRLTEAVDQAIADLELDGEADDAIIACWLRLEHAAAGAGVQRRQSETAAEFTARVLAAYEVDPSALAQLADLYREARFSAHVMGEPARQAARASLEQVRDGLRARVAVGGDAR